MRSDADRADYIDFQNSPSRQAAAEKYAQEFIRDVPESFWHGPDGKLQNNRNDPRWNLSRYRSRR
jgi:hypothetical protein